MWPPGIGLQDRVPNYVVLLRLRALVVSDDEMALMRPQVRVGKTIASESLMTRRKATNRHQNRAALLARNGSGRCLLTGWMVSGVEAALSQLRLLQGTWKSVASMRRENTEGAALRRSRVPMRGTGTE